MYLLLQHWVSHGGCFLNLISTRSKERYKILRHFKPLLSCVYVYVLFGLDWQVLVAEDAVSRALGPPGQTPNPRTKSKQITKEASKTSDSGTRLLAFSLHFKTYCISNENPMMKWDWGQRS
jgi:hypothetical protein